MRNWKTTLSGIAILLTIMVKALGGGVGVLTAEDYAGAAAGIGLIAARDHNNHATP